MIYKVDITDYPFDVSIKGLHTHNGHWAFEFMNGEIAGRKVIDYYGTVIEDGINLNEKYGYKEVFSYAFIKGKPFYFYKDNSGDIKIKYDSKTLPLVYKKVKHYGCCSEASFNPEWNDNMIWFFGLREGYWYYVESGVYE
jgi:hypothetical protein